MPTLSKATILALEQRAKDPGEFEAKFRYANYLAYEKEPADAQDTRLAIQYFTEVAESEYAEYKWSAYISLGILHSDTAPNLAEEFFHIIKPVSNHYGGACYYLGKLYGKDRNEEFKQNDVKSLAYYLIAYNYLSESDPRLKEIENLPTDLEVLTENGLKILKRNNELMLSPTNPKGADLAYKIFRFQHEIGWLSDTYYLVKLFALLAVADDKLKRKIHFQHAKIITESAKQNLDLDKFAQAKNYAALIADNPKNQNTRKAVKAAYLKQDIFRMLIAESNTPKTSGFVEPSSRIIKPVMNAAGTIMQGVGIALGNIIDFASLCMTKAASLICIDGGCHDGYRRWGDFFNAGFGYLVGKAFQYTGKALGFIGGGIASCIAYPFRAAYERFTYAIPRELQDDFRKYADYKDPSFARYDVSAKGNTNPTGKLFNTTSYGRMRNIFKWEANKKHDAHAEVRAIARDAEAFQPLFLRSYADWRARTATEAVRDESFMPRLLSTG